MQPAAAEAAKPPTKDDKPAKLKRRGGGTARRHRRKDQKLSLRTVYAWSDEECIRIVAQGRWGSDTLMPCPHCGTIDEHGWRADELRWSCSNCRRGFSVFSESPLADRKVDYSECLALTTAWAQNASGVPTNQLDKLFDTAYHNIYVHVQKLSEALMRSYNVGILAGAVEADGSDNTGHDSYRKRGEPQLKTKKTKAEIPAYLLQDGEQKEPKAGKAARQPSERRISFTMRVRRIYGRGGQRTVTHILKSESATNVAAVLRAQLSRDSALASDEDPSYIGIGKEFAAHDSIKHSEAYSIDGVHINLAESFNWRLQRAERGIYTNIEPKYLKDYGAAMAWREDVADLSAMDRLKHLLHFVLRAGLSRDWRRFTHGHHRKTEPLLPSAVPARSSGPRKGRHPLNGRHGLPPR